MQSVIGKIIQYYKYTSGRKFTNKKSQINRKNNGKLQNRSVTKTIQTLHQYNKKWFWSGAYIFKRLCVTSPYIQKNPHSMPNVLACMKKAGNTKTTKITCIYSMVPLFLTALNNCLTIVKVVGVHDVVLKENITNLQDGVSKLVYASWCTWEFTFWP